MGRSVKRKSSETSESELQDENETDLVEAGPVFKSGFFVPCHPLLIIGKL